MTAAPAVFVLLTTAGLAGLVARFNRSVPDEVPGEPPTPVLAALVSACCGLMYGLGESWYLGWKRLILKELIPHFPYVSINSVWMAPIVDTAIFVLIGLALVGAARVVRKRLSLRALVLVLAFIAVAGLILLTGRLSLAASALLALGIAVRLSSLAARRQGRFVWGARVWVPRLALVVAGIAVTCVAAPLIRERIELAGLPPAAPGARNVLVIIMDTQRAESMSLYGYERPTSESLARFAREGVVFERAVSPAPWTLPSHASMFTSRPANETGTTFQKRLDDTYPTIAEVMRGHGYVTAGFVGNLIFGTRLFGLDRGFIHYEGTPRNLRMMLESAWLWRTTRQQMHADPEHGLGVHKDAGRISRDVLSWLRRRPGDRPFLAFVNYFDVHGPYIAPRAYATRFADTTVPMVFRGEQARAYSAAELARLQAGYEGSAAYLDHELGALLDSLRARDLLRSTLVVIAADHGEAFGEHGTVGHGTGIHGQLVHVPLIIRGPGIAQGRRAKFTASLTNLAATIVDFAGIPDHPFRGISWLRRLALPEDRVPTVPAFSEYRRRHSVVLDQWHYIRDSTEYLYDWDRDPHEAVNLVDAADPAVLARLRHELDSLQASENADAAREQP